MLYFVTPSRNMIHWVMFQWVCSPSLFHSSLSLSLSLPAQFSSTQFNSTPLYNYYCHSYYWARLQGISLARIEVYELKMSSCIADQIHFGWNVLHFGCLVIHALGPYTWYSRERADELLSTWSLVLRFEHLTFSSRIVSLHLSSRELESYFVENFYLSLCTWLVLSLSLSLSLYVCMYVCLPFPFLYPLVSSWIVKSEFCDARDIWKYGEMDHKKKYPQKVQEDRKE